MIKHMRKIILLLAVGLSFSVVALNVGIVQAGLFDSFKDEACKGIAVDPSKTVNCNDAGGPLSGLLRNVLNIFSLVVGVIAVIMMIIGGIKYITSQGDSAAIATARNTIIYALVGLVVVVLAQMIVRFVLQRATS